MMIVSKKYLIYPVLFLATLLPLSPVAGQEDTAQNVHRNQIATNVLLPFFESADFAYERAIARIWAIGLSGAVYGEAMETLSTDYDTDLRTDYELMPYIRLYFRGNQRRSHFIEHFASISGVTDTSSFVRNVNEQGYGVYTRGSTKSVVGGLGIGYGYRFLFLDDRLVLEAQIGIRTNFEIDFVFFNAAPVRTGIRVGYRF